MRQMQDQIEGGMASHGAVDAVVIFAIDNGADPRTRARFERHIDTLRAMGVLRRPMRLCVGMWQGQMETSYELTRADFEAHVMRHDWVRNQDAVLGVVAGQAVLINQQGEVSSAGEWMKVRDDQAFRFYDGWTYYLDTKEYFVAA